MRTRWVLLLWALGVAVSGCATLRLEHRELAGEPWHEYGSAHFRVLSSLGEQTAVRAAWDLELGRQVLLAALGSGVDPAEQMDVILLRDREQLGTFVPPGVAGLAAHPDGRRVLVMAARTERGLPLLMPESLRHALLHALLPHAFPALPPWVGEGLAAALSTARPSSSRTHAVLGLPSPAHAASVRRLGVLPLHLLWDWERACSTPAGTETCSASAWAWVSYLTARHPAAWADLQQRLRRGEQPRAAFEAAFHAHAPQSLSQGLQAYLDEKVEPRLLPLQVPAASVTRRPLSPAQVHLEVLARLHVLSRPSTTDRPSARPGEERRGLVRQSVERALALEPDLFEAQLLQARLVPGPGGRQEALREIARRHPERGEVWKWLGLALLPPRDQEGVVPDAADEELRGSAELARDAAEAGKALARAQGLLSEDAQVLEGLARGLVLDGKGPEAVILARRAAALAPGVADVQDTLAAALHVAGGCQEAVVAQRHALALLDESAEEPAREVLRRRAARYEASCSTAPVHAASPPPPGLPEAAAPAPIPAVTEAGADPAQLLERAQALLADSSASLADRQEALVAAARVARLRADVLRLLGALPSAQERVQLCRALDFHLPLAVLELTTTDSFGDPTQADVWVDGERLGSTPYRDGVRACAVRLEVVEHGTLLREGLPLELSLHATRRLHVRFPGRPQLHVVSLVGELSRVERSWARGDFANAGVRYDWYGRLLAVSVALKGGLQRGGSPGAAWTPIVLPQLDVFVGASGVLTVSPTLRLYVTPGVGMASLVHPTARLALTASLADRWVLSLTGQAHTLPQLLGVVPFPESIFFSTNAGVGFAF